MPDQKQTPERAPEPVLGTWEQMQQTSSELQNRLLDQKLTAAQRAQTELNLSHALLGLEQKDAAWENARKALDGLIATQQWEAAAEACNILYQCEQPASMIALAHGVWLAVTYPVNPDLTVALLQHVIDETPHHSDGAAVAAVTAHYIADLRSADQAQRDNLLFVCTQLIAIVAKRHSQVQNQEQLDMWMKRLELREPQVFLPRLAKVLNIITGDKWWFDRDALRAQLPD